jgi:hypothetical protein
MSLDLFTITLVTALVIIVCGVLYISETLLRRDGLSGRLWAAAFLGGIFTVLCYLVWAVDPSAFVAVAIGNAGFVSTAAFLWLGARAFNGRRLRAAAWTTAAVAAVVLLTALLAGPDGGDWAGAVPLFLGNALLAALGAVETRRGVLAERWSAVGLTVVLLIESVWFTVRTVVFLVAGPDSDLFRTAFDSRIASLLTVTLTIVAVVVTSVLRAGESTVRGQQDSYVIRVGLDGVLLPASFRSALSTLLERTRVTGETVCAIAVRMDDLPRVATAFGPGDAEALAAAWRDGVRRYAPSASLVGEYGATVLVAGYVTASFADVRRTASIMHRRLLNDFAGLTVSVVPSVGMGIALTDQVGYDFAALVDAAADASARSASSSDASVIVAER